MRSMSNSDEISGTVENILKGRLYSIPSPSPSENSNYGRESLLVKAKHCWALSINFCKQQVCLHHKAIFCLIISSNVRYENKYTKRSSNTLLRLVYLFL